MLTLLSLINAANLASHIPFPKTNQYETHFIINRVPARIELV